MHVILNNVNTIVIIMDYVIMGHVHVSVSSQVTIVTNWHVKTIVIIMVIVTRLNVIVIKDSKVNSVTRE